MKIQFSPKNESIYQSFLDHMILGLDNQMFDEIDICFLFDKQAAYLIVYHAPILEISRPIPKTETLDKSTLMHDFRYVQYCMKMSYHIDVEQMTDTDKVFESYIQANNFFIFGKSDSDSKKISFLEMLKGKTLNCKSINAFKKTSTRKKKADTQTNEINWNYEILLIECAEQKPMFDFYITHIESFPTLKNFTNAINPKFFFPIDAESHQELCETLSLAYHHFDFTDHQSQRQSILLNKNKDAIAIGTASHKAVFEHIPNTTTEIMETLGSHYDAQSEYYYTIDTECVVFLNNLFKCAKDIVYHTIPDMIIPNVFMPNPFQDTPEIDSHFGFAFIMDDFYTKVKPIPLLKEQSIMQMYENTLAYFKYQVFKPLSQRLITRIHQILSASETTWISAKLNILKSNKTNCYGLYIVGNDLLGNDTTKGYILPFHIPNDIEFLEWADQKTIPLYQFSEKIFQRNIELSFLCLDQDIRLRAKFQANDSQKVFAQAIYAIHTEK